MQTIETILKTRNFSQGINVEEFESKLSATLKINPEQVVVVSSGTAALMIAVEIVDPYKVTMPASTFIATGNVFAEKFIDIEYLDINKDTWNASDAMN
jgi:dTDP-4-amino-4,6-dideoxygalactose transaminase